MFDFIGNLGFRSHPGDHRHHHTPVSPADKGWVHPMFMTRAEWRFYQSQARNLDHSMPLVVPSDPQWLVRYVWDRHDEFPISFDFPLMGVLPSELKVFTGPDIDDPWYEIRKEQGLGLRGEASTDPSGQGSRASGSSS